MEKLRLTTWGDTEVWLVGTTVYKVEIVNDDDGCESPRHDDNFGTLLLWGSSSHYSDRMQALIATNTKNVVILDDKCQLVSDVKTHLILPVYRYSHSAVAYNTTGFPCPWDSGQIGYIYCSKAKAIKEFGNKNLTKTVKERALACMVGEVETFSAWANGQIYGYIVTTYDLASILGSAISLEDFKGLTDVEKRAYWHEWVEIGDYDFEDHDGKEVALCWGYIETKCSITEMDCYKEAMGYVN